MGRPKRLYPYPKRDGRLVSVQFSLNGEANSILFGQTPKLGKLGDQIRGHISELGDGYVNRVTDIVNVGDQIEVEVINVDDRGKIKLSRKAVLQPSGSARS